MRQQLGTAPANSVDTATKGYVDAALGGYAPQASPALTGTPTAPTAAALTNSTQLATTAFVYAMDSMVNGTNAQSGTSYTLVAADAGKAVEMTSASANTVTVPANVFPVGTVIEICGYGTGVTTIAAGSGVTIRTASTLVLRATYSVVTIRQRATNEWILAGDVN